MRPSDTTDAAWRRQLEALSRLTPERRFALALEMSDEAREIARDGVRHRHPEYSTAEVDAMVKRLWLGDDSFTRLWPELAHLRP